MRSFHIIPDQAEWDTTYIEVFKTPLYHHEGTPEELAAEAKPELEDLLPRVDRDGDAPRTCPALPPGRAALGRRVPGGKLPLRRPGERPRTVRSRTG